MLQKPQHSNSASSADDDNDNDEFLFINALAGYYILAMAMYASSSKWSLHPIYNTNITALVYVNTY